MFQIPILYPNNDDDDDDDDNRPNNTFGGYNLRRA